MNVLIFAYRNLVRNRRRSLVTLLAISFGLVAVAVFAGHTKSIYNGLSNMAIHSEMLGHLSISKPGTGKEGKIDPEKFLLTPEEIGLISDIVKKNAPQSFVIPRIALDGLISNGKVSAIFFAYAIDANDLKRRFARSRSSPSNGYFYR